MKVPVVSNEHRFHFQVVQSIDIDFADPSMGTMSEESCLFELDAKPELVIEAAVQEIHNASDDEGHRGDLQV